MQDMGGAAGQYESVAISGAGPSHNEEGNALELS